MEGNGTTSADSPAPILNYDTGHSTLSRGRLIWIVLLGLIAGSAVGLLGGVLVTVATFTLDDKPAWYGPMTWVLFAIFSPGLGLLTAAGLVHLTRGYWKPQRKE